MSDSWKSLLQSLLIPIAIAFVGFLISNALQQKQMALDKLKFTEQVIDDAFTGDNPYKALALSKLMPSLTDDKTFATDVSAMIDSFYFNKAKLAVQTGDKDAFSQITDAAKLIDGKGSNLLKSLRNDPLTSSADSANDEELKGMKAAQDGDMDAAKIHLGNAGNKSSLFKEAKEISQMIPPPSASPNNQPIIQQKVQDSIRLRILPQHTLIIRKPVIKALAQ